MKAELRIRGTTRRAEQKIINDLKKSLDTTMKMASKVSEQVLKSDSISRTTILIASRLSKAVEKVEKNTALTQSVLSESIDRLGVLNVRISLMVKSSLLDSLDKLNRLTKENLEEILLGFWRYNFTFAKACDEVLKENRFHSGTFWFEGDRRKNISKFDATTILDEKGGIEDQDIECIIEYSIPINSITGITKYSDLNGLCWCSKIYHSEFVDVYYIRLDFGQVHEEEKSLELINNNQPNGIHEDYILRFENNGDLVKTNSFTYVGCYSIPRDFIKKAKH